MVEVILTHEAATELDATQEPIHARLIRILERLQNWPDVSGAKPLRGNLAGHWRMRTGDYRLQFCIDGERVVVEKIGHRRDFYE